MKEKVTKLLIKYGNNPQDVEKMVNDNLELAMKMCENGTPAKIANIIRTIA